MCSIPKHFLLVAMLLIEAYSDPCEEHQQVLISQNNANNDLKFHLKVSTTFQTDFSYTSVFSPNFQFFRMFWNLISSFFSIINPKKDFICQFFYISLLMELSKIFFQNIPKSDGTNRANLSNFHKKVLKNQWN